ncbi:MAG: hypothetical protein QOG10_4707 [Kribbellaceae bacterium]|nr:hypothetical protein [Kribbellaceae bacterium]
MTAANCRDICRALETDLEMYPDEGLGLLLEIAGVHRRLGDHDRAVRIWRDLIAEGGEDSDYARVEYLDHLFAIGRPDEARAELSALKTGRRTSSGAWQMAAEVLQEQGELAEALTWPMATERLTQEELAVLGSDAGWASQPGMLVRRSIRAEIGLPPISPTCWCRMRTRSLPSSASRSLPWTRQWTPPVRVDPHLRRCGCCSGRAASSRPHGSGGTT